MVYSSVVGTFGGSELAMLSLLALEVEAGY